MRSDTQTLEPYIAATAKSSRFWLSLYAYRNYCYILRRSVFSVRNGFLDCRFTLVVDHVERLGDRRPILEPCGAHIERIISKTIGGVDDSLQPSFTLGYARSVAVRKLCAGLTQGEGNIVCFCVSVVEGAVRLSKSWKTIVCVGIIILFGRI